MSNRKKQLIALVVLVVLSAAINKESVITGMELLKTFGLIVLISVILLLLAWVVTKSSEYLQVSAAPIRI